jgi:hypothetical protein
VPQSVGVFSTFSSLCDCSLNKRRQSYESPFRNTNFPFSSPKLQLYSQISQP